jgi:hypothetical protein
VLVIPPGREAVEIVSAATIVMVSVFVAVSAGVLESVALTVKLAVPAVVGVPVMLPLGANANPLGTGPAAIDHVIRAAPPVDVNVAL